MTTKNNIKLIKNYNENEFSFSELSAIDYINDNPEEFLKVHNLNDFCENKPFSATTLQRLAKKIGFSTATEMKGFYTGAYIDELKSLIEFNKQLNKDIDKTVSNNNMDIDLFSELNFQTYCKQLMMDYKTVDWNIHKKLQDAIFNCKNIYVYQPDQIFAISSFDIFSHYLGIKIYRIESYYRFKLIQEFGIFEDSIFIVTKAFSKLDEFETKILDYFKKNNVPIFTISGIDGLFPDVENNIVIGNYKNTLDEYDRIVHFKTFYDPLISIIIFNLYLKLISKKKR